MTSIDDQNPTVQYSGQWLKVQGQPLYESYFGTVSLSYTAGSTLTVPFHGTSISVFGGSEFGQELVVSYSIDNGIPEDVTGQTFPASNDAQRTWQSKDLPSGDHTLHVTLKDAGQDGTVWFDYFVVRNDAVQTPLPSIPLPTSSTIPPPPTATAADAKPKLPVTAIIVSVVAVVAVLILLSLWCWSRQRKLPVLSPPLKEIPTTVASTTATHPPDRKSDPDDLRWSHLFVAPNHNRGSGFSGPPPSPMPWSNSTEEAPNYRLTDVSRLRPVAESPILQRFSLTPIPELLARSDKGSVSLPSNHVSVSTVHYQPSIISEFSRESSAWEDGHISDDSSLLRSPLL